MRAAGIHTVQSPAEIGHTLAGALGKAGKSKSKPKARPNKKSRVKTKSKKRKR